MRIRRRVCPPTHSPTKSDAFLNPHQNRLHQDDSVPISSIDFGAIEGVHMGRTGRHRQRVLTARGVQSAAPCADRPRRVSDGEGLYFLVAQSGAKSWILRTVVNGKRCDLGLGSVTIVSLASLAEAREEAVRLRKIARSGGDPARGATPRAPDRLPALLGPVLRVAQGRLQLSGPFSYLGSWGEAATMLVRERRSAASLARIGGAPSHA